MPVRLDARSSDFELSFSTLLKGKRETLSDVSAAVAEILASVQARGDAAVIDYTHRFDRVSAPDLRALKVSWAEILAAETACPPRSFGGARSCRAADRRFSRPPDSRGSSLYRFCGG